MDVLPRHPVKKKRSIYSFNPHLFEHTTKFHKKEDGYQFKQITCGKNKFEYLKTKYSTYTTLRMDNTDSIPVYSYYNHFWIRGIRSLFDFEESSTESR